MSRLCSLIALFLLSAFFGTPTALAATEPFALLHSLFDPGITPQAFTEQGWSVGIDGRIVVTGVPYDDQGAIDSGVVKVYDASTGGILHTLINPEPSQDDYFGSAVGISGTKVVVGADWGDTGAHNAGSVYVYDLASAVPAVPILRLINPNPAQPDQYGHSVAISGTRVVVGASGKRIGSIHAGTVYVYDLATATPAAPISTLNNPNPGELDAFGSSVAISGTRIVVGAQTDDTGATNAGNAYLYDLASATPTVPTRTLNNPSPGANDHFGVSVAISDTWAVVGAWLDDTGANNAGSAYVYDLAASTNAHPVVTLFDPGPTADGYFGVAVAVFGSQVVVGAHRGQTDLLSFGSVHVFDLASATPEISELTLYDYSPNRGQNFGAAVAISGARVVVGGPNYNLLAPHTGIAYVYDLHGTTPIVPLTEFNHPSPAFHDFFGTSVAISGTRLVIGARGDDTGSQNSGSAYVYHLTNSTPTLPAVTLVNPSPAENDSFGYSVAASGARVVVGAPYDTIGNFAAGSAYAYDMANGTPTMPVLALTNPSPTASVGFGSSVAISGTLVAVGWPFDDTGAQGAGSVHVYDLVNSTPTVPQATLTNPSPAKYDYFGHGVAVSGTRVVVGVPSDYSGPFKTGTVYVYDMATATPTVPVFTLASPRRAAFDLFGYSVAISGTRVVVGASGEYGKLSAGVAYVYELAGNAPTVPVATLTNPAPSFTDGFGSSVTISGARVVVAAPFDDAGTNNTGSAYVYHLDSATPLVPVAILTNPSPALRDEFGTSVAIDGATIVVGTPRDDTNAEDRGAAYIFGLAPTLRITPAALGLATVSWTSAISSGFVLQYAESPAPINWINAPSGAANPVTISTTNVARFYRLIQQ